MLPNPIKWVYLDPLGVVTMNDGNSSYVRWYEVCLTLVQTVAFSSAVLLDNLGGQFFA